MGLQLVAQEGEWRSRMHQLQRGLRKAEQAQVQADRRAQELAESHAVEVRPAGFR
jgi:hypothetical protein